MVENLWQASATPAPETSGLDQSIRADVVVVGAGYTGVSTALHLSRMGVDVAVLEAEGIGFGGSGRNGGQVNAGFLTLPAEVLRLVGPEKGARMNTTFHDSADLVFDLIERYGIECDAVRKGNLFLAHDHRTRTLVETYRDQHQALGAQIEWLDSEATRARVGSAIYKHAALDRRSGTVQPLSYSRGLAHAAIRENARVYTGSRVTTIARHHDGWWATTVNGAHVTADQVVLATDSYSDSLWPGLAHTLIPITAQQIATEPLGENVGKTILNDGQATADRMRFVHYFRKDRDGRLLLIGAGNTPPGAQILKRFFPQLDAVRIEYKWNGEVGISRDHLPCLYRLAPGISAVMGYSGRGLSSGTMVGKLLARHLNDQLPENELPLPLRQLDPQPFRNLRSKSMNLLLTTTRWVDETLLRTRDS